MLRYSNRTLFKRFSTHQQHFPTHKHPSIFPSLAAKNAHVATMEQYHNLYNESVNDSNTFWDHQAKDLIHWTKEYTKVSEGGFSSGDVRFFLNGKLNVSFNCIDRHVENGKGNQIAIIYEGDEAHQCKKITYQELLNETSKVANLMLKFGVKRGDIVTVYMPTSLEIAYVILACARIGAIHSVVFAGFSAEALENRIENASSKWIFTSDVGYRGGKTLDLKKIVDAAVESSTCVEKIFSFQRGKKDIVKHPKKKNIDVNVTVEAQKMRPYCPPVEMDAEDPLFILYTSGSTGAPKGLVHTTGGYLTYAAYTHKTVFDFKEGEIFACVADVGWITGHSYIIYGPLCNGATTICFEGTPLFPNPSRYWEMIQTHKINQFYTAPTAIRALMAHGSEFVDKFDLSSLRIIGSVGEPINPEAWHWYFTHVGKEKCAIVDTYWQTETGGHIITPLSCTPLKPGAASFPMMGVNLELLDAVTGEVKTGNDVEGVLCISKPWPGIARTVFNDHERYMSTYLNVYKNKYFTGDGAIRDQDGYYYITGRVDDVMNVSGHRLGTAEIESALVGEGLAVEAAVCGYNHAIKGTAICAFVTPSLETNLDTIEKQDKFIKDLKNAVISDIGKIAVPDMIVVTPLLPKTRSGKIMRRLLRKIAAQETDKASLGDTSTLSEPGVVDDLIAKVNLLMSKKKN